MTDSHSPDALRLEDVTKRFGAMSAVDRVSFRAPRGCVYGLIGPNGAGKTTTIRIILDILRPDAGRVEVLGQPLSERLKDRIGYLPEERGLYKKMRVRDALTYFGRLKSARSDTLKTAIPQWLERFDLSEWENRRIEELSKGMQQKVQIISTVLHEPDLLVLDEPFAGLDPVNVNALKDVLLEQKRAGRTILFSTHVMEVAEKICDEVMMMHRGRKVLDGSMEAILTGHGESVVVVEYDGDGVAIGSLPQVASFNDYGNYVEVRLRESADAQDLLRALIDRARVRRFETRRTSLTEVFLRLAGEDGDG